jgi:methylenetetrahydrofolate dehydrogenase (NADP+)/methenyltetrahydrofolate cyclohydrolase
MQILDGKVLSDKIKADLKEKIPGIKSQYGRVPGLATVLVGNDDASKVYVGMKVKSCEAIGMKSFSYPMKEETTIEELKSLIRELNSNDEIDGILVQLPLPKHLKQYTDEVLDLIDPMKDVDGFGLVATGLLQRGVETYASCTPKGMIKLLEANNIDIEGKEVVIINRTNVIGKPLLFLFLNRNATVTVCHSRTKNIEFHTKRADILAVGVGKLDFIKADMVKEGVVILDAGINRNAEGKLVGDVDYQNVAPKCKAITPVPGGVGPMTIACLLENTCDAFIERMKKQKQ